MRTGILMAAVAVAGLAWLLLGGTQNLEPYRSFASPDARFQLQVLRQRPRLALMPGQASDAPGRIRLLDAQGRVLSEQGVEMVQWVAQVEWSPGRVVVPMILDWPLPGGGAAASAAQR